MSRAPFGKGRRLVQFLLTLAVLSQAGCDVWDRYRRFPAGRDGSIWRPTGAAEAAFDAQVAHAGDLIAGHGTTTSDGLTAGVAVERARLGRMPSLPASTISNIGSNGAATAAPQVGGN